MVFTVVFNEHGDGLNITWAGPRVLFHPAGRTPYSLPKQLAQLPHTAKHVLVRTILRRYGFSDQTIHITPNEFANLVQQALRHPASYRELSRHNSGTIVNPFGHFGYEGYKVINGVLVPASECNRRIAESQIAQIVSAVRAMAQEISSMPKAPEHKANHKANRYRPHRRRR